MKIELSPSLSPAPALDVRRFALPRQAHGGAALVITLAFVVLLTGLVVAFFSRSVSARLVSNSNVNLTRTRLFAQGAVDTVLGDLKQEIVSGSTSSTVTAGTTTITMYAPKPGDNTTVSSMMPAQAILQAGQSLPTGVDYPNLVKRSAFSVPFYPASSVYDGKAGPQRASNVSTLSLSQNGRSISPTRWNSPYLLPRLVDKQKADPSDAVGVDDGTPLGATTALTPATNPTAAGTWAYAPDWILVNRDPTKPLPILFNNSLTANMKWSAVNGTTVIGRYAYNIYHEGGLLDVNAAGYPTPLASTNPPNSFPAAADNYKTVAAYKSNITFADLLALTDSANKPYLSQDQIDQIAAWRNTATLKIAQSLPNLVWTAQTKQDFFGLMGYSNANGFISPNNATLTTAGGLSDRLFTSRQQLIQMFMRGLAAKTYNAYNAASPKAPTAAERSNAENALQYLTTFSRDYNQPSYSPEKGRPTVTAAANAGGNDAVGSPSDPTSTLGINQPFLNVRVKYASFMRSDKTNGVVGEPLVKKRFLLSRLAWLTYLGPSATRAQVSSGNIPTTEPGEDNADHDLWNLQNNGVTVDFLKQGTAENIKSYFGLTWNGSNGWIYNVHTAATGASIKKLQEIADNSSRVDDPDFIELLRAAINVGSIAKSATTAPTAIRKVASPGWQDYNNDISSNYAIIQMAANIIDQYDGDGFPTKITYNGKDFYGVENLPYLYRMQPGLLKIRDSDPASTVGMQSSTTGILHAGAAALKDTGLVMIMAMPEVWNPHDRNAPLGAPRPKNFGVYGDSGGLAHVSNYYTLDNNQSVVTTRDLSSNMVNGDSNASPKVPYFGPTVGGGNGSDAFAQKYKRQALARDNSLMTFTVPTSTPTTRLFSEPTLLARPGKPAGSNLAYDPATVGNLDGGKVKNIQTASGAPAFISGSGFLSSQANPLRLAPNEPGYSATPSNSDTYMGIYWGMTPLRWVSRTNGSATIPSTIYTAYTVGYPADDPAWKTSFITAYKDSSGTWIEYDRKDMPVAPAWLFPPLGTGAPTNKSTTNQNDQVAQSALIQYEATPSSVIDPRTSRFGAMNGDHVPGQNYCGPNGPAFVSGVQKGSWIDSDNMTRTSDRPDFAAGYGTATRSDNRDGQSWGSQPMMASIGWSVKGDTGASAGYPRPGLFSQNDPLFKNDGTRYKDDPGNAGTTAPQFYADPDGVVRRGMGGYASGGDTLGLPMARAINYKSANGSGEDREAKKQSQSRPWILNRPLRSVGELGYVFSGTPWRNLDLSTPESGNVALLDVFTMTDTQDSKGLVGGATNINTKQKLVLRAILNGAYKDAQDVGSTTASPTVFTIAESDKIITQLMQTTSSPDPLKGPLSNISQLVGRYNAAGKTTVSGATAPFNINGSKSYIGFSDDLSTVLTSNTDKAIGRFREASIRPLAAGATSTRVWNLMIDVIAQTGRYPANVTDARKFVVEGEQRLWVHVAIDRFTGDVIDMQTEEVEE